MEGGHESSVFAMDWHPLGHILASGSNDHTTKFWTRNRPGDPMNDSMNSKEEAVAPEVATQRDLPGLGTDLGDFGRRTGDKGYSRTRQTSDSNSMGGRTHQDNRRGPLQRR